MGIDISVTKGYGFLVPLEEFDGVYEELREFMDETQTYPHALIGVSGSYWMQGPSEGDMIWVSASRLVKDDEPKSSMGFIWTFDEVTLTQKEVETLREIALKYFNMEEPKFEHFVALSVY